MLLINSFCGLVGKSDLSHEWMRGKIIKAFALFTTHSEEMSWFTSENCFLNRCLTLACANLAMRFPYSLEKCLSINGRSPIPICAEIANIFFFLRWCLSQTWKSKLLVILRTKQSAWYGNWPIVSPTWKLSPWACKNDSCHSVTLTGPPRISLLLVQSPY